MRLFVSDFVGSSKVSAMSLEEVGAYVLLLFHSWREGPLENDSNRLARVIRATPEEFDRIWPAVRACFQEDESGKLFNPRMERERLRALDRSGLAKRAARARWDKAGGVGLKGLGGDEEQDLPHAVRHMKAEDILEAWSRLQERDVSMQERKTQRRFAQLLARQHSRDDVVRAFVGIQQIWEHKKGRPWDLKTLIDKFSLALTAADEHPEIKARKKMDKFMEETVG